MRLEDVDTPSLILDLDAFERNIAKMANFAANAGVRLRPHAKTHKCPAVALRQIAAGAVGQCVQKVGEAEALVAGGVRDVLISNEIVGESKLRRIAEIAKTATVALCFDDADQVDIAARIFAQEGVTVGGLVEIEVGMGRCGIDPGVPAGDLAKRIADAKGLQFKGLQAYSGVAQHMLHYSARRTAIDRAEASVRETLAALERVGLTCDIIGGAGTGTFQFEAASGLYNELQVGSYVFMDTEYARIEGVDGAGFSEFEHALFILATVMSRAAPDRAIVDAGMKSYSMEKGPPWVHGLHDIEVTGASDEHGKMKLGANAPALALGTKLKLIPGHCDPTVNLHDCYIGIRNGIVEEILPITARGAAR
jgi:D-serine deaminase-like pyridoxal phosphate-dependent protein